MPDTRERLRSLVEQVSEKPVPSDPEESLFESGVLDSFLLADLVPAVEGEFGIKIPNSDLTPRKFDSLARIEAYIAARV